MEKHYVPSIEEFHVGFEYELLTTVQEKRHGSIVNTKQFRTKVVKDLSNSVTYNLKEDLRASWVRVKYLDKEDIESLGFEYNGGKMVKNFQDRFHIVDGNRQLNLVYTYGNKLLRLDVEDLVMFEESYNYLFQGIVKNKSELKRILEQVQWKQ